ncbi:electron transport complex subunit E [Thioalkalivibrio sulfidiphilus]|uniref:electron transport complex subunit E n=1 Tax=Thioalkalivibrio sulfidiphilus TaxID=1033854 RepID=UPI003B39ACFB
MSDISYREINANGFWHNNPGLVQLLGLCPLLAISGTVVNALGLGLATTLTLVASNVTVSLIRHWVRPEIRIPVFVLIIASVVTAIELAMNAFFHELYLILGIFIPLIVTNCAIIGRAEAFASKQPIPKALADGLAMGLGFTCVLVALGAFREAVGHGTLLADAHLMFGEAARGFSLTLFEEYRGFLLALLPPGAFIALGLLIALKNIIDARLQKRQPAQAAVPVEAAG